MKGVGAVVRARGCEVTEDGRAWETWLSVLRWAGSVEDRRV